MASEANVVFKALDKIQELGNNAYKSLEAWNNFPDQVRYFEDTYWKWKKTVDDSGVQSTAMSFFLDRAKEDLEKELRKLEKREKNKLSHPKFAKIIGVLWSPRIVFPDSCGKTLDELRERLNTDMVDVLASPQNMQKLTNAALASKYCLSFKEDIRYVPLRETKEKVMDALKRSGPVVILLYGGIGTGKSSFARDLALQFYRECKSNDHTNPSESLSRTGASVNSASTERTGELENPGREIHETLSLYVSTPPDQTVRNDNDEENFKVEFVRYYECGRNFDSSSALEQLQHDLKGADANEEGSSKHNASVKVERRLQGHLKNRRVLIIVDNVNDRDLVENLVRLSGQNVKIFITSPSPNLCDGLNFQDRGFSFFSFRIEKMKTEDAKKLLQTHIDVGGGPWPDFEKLALPEEIGDIIEGVDVNPMALGCIAASIHMDVCNDFGEWKWAESELSRLLDATYEYPIRVHGKVHPQTFWEAMEEGFKLLEEAQKNLLILIGAFQNPSKWFHSQLVRFLYEAVFKRESLSVYSNKLDDLLKKLSDRQFIDITIDQPPESRMWSMYLLVQLFIEVKRSQDKEDMFSRCRNDRETIVDLVKGIAGEGAQGHEFRKREEAAHFLAHLGGGDLDAKCAIINCERSGLTALIHALHEKNNNDIQQNAALALGNLASGDLSIKRRIIMALDGLAVSHLITAMDGDSKSYLRRQNAARAVAHLVDGDGNDATENKKEILRKNPEMLKPLVRGVLVSDEDDQRNAYHGLQIESARALANLIAGTDNLEIAWRQLEVQHNEQHRLAISHLFGVLISSPHDELREQVARIFLNLANAGDELRAIILERSYDDDHTEGNPTQENPIRVLSELFGIFSRSDFGGGKCELRKNVGWTLVNLSKTDRDDIKVWFLLTPNAIKNLSDIVTDDSIRDIQLGAATIFRNILVVKDLNHKLEFVSTHREAVSSLTSVFNRLENTNSDLKVLCKEALHNLLTEGWGHKIGREIHNNNPLLKSEILKVLPELASVQ